MLPNLFHSNPRPTVVEAVVHHPSVEQPRLSPGLSPYMMTNHPPGITKSGFLAQQLPDLYRTVFTTQPPHNYRAQVLCTRVSARALQIAKIL